MPATPAVWLVLPTYDEAENIEAIVAAARGELPPARQILIVDDDSPDGTGRIADRLAGEEPEVRSWRIVDGAVTEEEVRVAGNRLAAAAG